MSPSCCNKGILIPRTLLLALAAVLLTSTVPCQSQESKLYTVPQTGLSQFPVREAESRATEDYLDLEKFVGIGQKVPSYNLLDVNKKPFNLSRLQGRIVVIDFWATWCGPCLRAMPHLGKLAQQYNSQHIVFLSVCESQDWKAFQQRVKQFKGTQLNFYMDSKSGSGGKGLRTLLHNRMGVPVQIIINQKGEVAGALQGYDERTDADLKQLRRSIDVALQLSGITKNLPSKTSPPADMPKTK